MLTHVLYVVWAKPANKSDSSLVALHKATVWLLQYPTTGWRSDSSNNELTYQPFQFLTLYLLRSDQQLPVFTPIQPPLLLVFLVRIPWCITTVYMGSLNWQTIRSLISNRGRKLTKEVNLQATASPWYSIINKCTHSTQVQCMLTDLYQIKQRPILTDLPIGFLDLLLHTSSFPWEFIFLKYNLTFHVWL